AAVTVLGVLDRLSLFGLDSTAQYGLLHSGSGMTEMHVSHVTGMPSVALARAQVAPAGVTLRGSQVAGAPASHLTRAATQLQLVRAVGAEVRVDVSALPPKSGDVVFTTNAALACGAGPVIDSGTVWKHLATAAPYTPP